MCLQILKDDLRRVLDDPGAVIASVEAGTQLNLPSWALIFVPNTFGLMGIGSELVFSK